MEQLNNVTLQQKQAHQLVKGDFSPDEALQIISNLISGKINFHTLRDFSLKEQTGQNDEYSLKRIEELSCASSSIRALVIQADQQGKRLTINAEIFIELIDNNTLTNK